MPPSFSFNPMEIAVKMEFSQTDPNWIIALIWSLLAENLCQSSL